MPRAATWSIRLRRTAGAERAKSALAAASRVVRPSWSVRNARSSTTRAVSRSPTSRSRPDENGCRAEQSHLDRPGHRDVGEAGAVGGEPRADRHDHRRATGLGEEPVEEVELPARRGDRGELDSVGQKGRVVARDREPFGAATPRGHDPGDRPGGGEGALAIGAGRVAADHDERVGPSVIDGTGLGPEGVRRGEVGEDGPGCGAELVAALVRRRGVDADELDGELLGPRHGAERRDEGAERPVDELVGSVDPESPTATEDEQIRRVLVVTERDERLDEAAAVGGERREVRRLDRRVEHATSGRPAGGGRATVPPAARVARRNSTPSGPARTSRTSGGATSSSWTSRQSRRSARSIQSMSGASAKGSSADRVSPTGRALGPRRSP